MVRATTQLKISPCTYYKYRKSVKNLRYIRVKRLTKGRLFVKMYHVPWGKRRLFSCAQKPPTKRDKNIAFFKSFDFENIPK